MKQLNIKYPRVLRDITCSMLRKNLQTKCENIEKIFLHPFVSGVDLLLNSRCINKLVIGFPYNTVGPPDQEDTKYVFAHGFGKMADIYKYVTKIRNYIRVPNPTQPYSLTILVNRTGRRRILNLNTIHTHLVSSTWNHHDVKIFNWEKMKLFEQIETVSRCGIVLTAPTGGNAHLTFMPPNSALIIPTIYKDKNTEISLDSGLWSFIPNINLIWYHTELNEVILTKKKLNWK